MASTLDDPAGEVDHACVVVNNGVYYSTQRASVWHATHLGWNMDDAASDEDVSLLSVTTRDGRVRAGSAARFSAEDEADGLLVPHSRVTFVHPKHKIVFCVDMSASMATLDCNGHVLVESVFAALERCLHALVRPLHLPGIAHELPAPELYISVIAQDVADARFKSLTQGVLLTPSNVQNVIHSLRTRFEEVKTVLMTRRRDAHQGATGVGGAAGGGVGAAGAHGAGPHGGGGGAGFGGGGGGGGGGGSEADAEGPESMMDVCIDHALFSLDLLPTDAAPAMVIITDGVSAIPETSMYDSKVQLLNELGVPCHIVRIGCVGTPALSFGYLCDPELSAFMAEATGGQLFEVADIMREPLRAPVKAAPVPVVMSVVPTPSEATTASDEAELVTPRDTEQTIKVISPRADVPGDDGGETRATAAESTSGGSMAADGDEGNAPSAATGAAAATADAATADAGVEEQAPAAEAEAGASVPGEQTELGGVGPAEPGPSKVVSPRELPMPTEVDTTVTPPRSPARSPVRSPMRSPETVPLFGSRFTRKEPVTVLRMFRDALLLRRSTVKSRYTRDFPFKSASATVWRPQVNRPYKALRSTQEEIKSYAINAPVRAVLEHRSREGFTIENITLYGARVVRPRTVDPSASTHPDAEGTPSVAPSAVPSAVPSTVPSTVGTDTTTGEDGAAPDVAADRSTSPRTTASASTGDAGAASANAGAGAGGDDSTNAKAAGAASGAEGGTGGGSATIDKKAPASSGAGSTVAQPSGPSSANAVAPAMASGSGSGGAGGNSGGGTNSSGGTSGSGGAGGGPDGAGNSAAATVASSAVAATTGGAAPGAAESAAPSGAAAPNTSSATSTAAAPSGESAAALPTITEHPSEEGPAEDMVLEDHAVLRVQRATVRMRLWWHRNALIELIMTLPDVRMLWSAVPPSEPVAVKISVTSTLPFVKSLQDVTRLRSQAHVAQLPRYLSSVFEADKYIVFLSTMQARLGSACVWTPAGFKFDDPDSSLQAHVSKALMLMDTWDDDASVWINLFDVHHMHFVVVPTASYDGYFAASPPGAFSAAATSSSASGGNTGSSAGGAADSKAQQDGAAGSAPASGGSASAMASASGADPVPAGSPFRPSRRTVPRVQHMVHALLSEWATFDAANSRTYLRVVDPGMPTDDRALRGLCLVRVRNLASHMVSVQVAFYGVAPGAQQRELRDLRQLLGFFDINDATQQMRLVPCRKLVPRMLVCAGDQSFEVNMMSEYMFRKRWIWTVEDKAVGRLVVRNLVDVRLGESFVMVQRGRFTLMKEFDLTVSTAPSHIDLARKQAAEYLVYRSAGCIVSELWLEPQSGYHTFVMPDSSVLTLGETQLFEQLANCVYDTDMHIIAAISTLSHIIHVYHGEKLRHRSKKRMMLPSTFDRDGDDEDDPGFAVSDIGDDDDDDDDDDDVGGADGAATGGAGGGDAGAGGPGGVRGMGGMRGLGHLAEAAGSKAAATMAGVHGDEDLVHFEQVSDDLSTLQIVPFSLSHLLAFGVSHQISMPLLTETESSVYEEVMTTPITRAPHGLAQYTFGSSLASESIDGDSYSVRSWRSSMKRSIASPSVASGPSVIDDGGGTDAPSVRHDYHPQHPNYRIHGMYMEVIKGYCDSDLAVQPADLEWAQVPGRVVPPLAHCFAKVLDTTKAALVLVPCFDYFYSTTFVEGIPAADSSRHASVSVLVYECSLDTMTAEAKALDNSMLQLANSTLRAVGATPLVDMARPKRKSKRILALDHLERHTDVSLATLHVCSDLKMLYDRTVVWGVFFSLMDGTTVDAADLTRALDRCTTESAGFDLGDWCTMLRAGSDEEEDVSAQEIASAGDSGEERDGDDTGADKGGGDEAEATLDAHAGAVEHSPGDGAEPLAAAAAAVAAVAAAVKAPLDREVVQDLADGVEKVLGGHFASVPGTPIYYYNCPPGEDDGNTEVGDEIEDDLDRASIASICSDESDNVDNALDRMASFAVQPLFVQVELLMVERGGATQTLSWSAGHMTDKLATAVQARDVESVSVHLVWYGLGELQERESRSAPDHRGTLITSTTLQLSPRQQVVVDAVCLAMQSHVSDAFLRLSTRRSPVTPELLQSVRDHLDLVAEPHKEDLELPMLLVHAREQVARVPEWLASSPFLPLRCIGDVFYLVQDGGARVPFWMLITVQGASLLIQFHINHECGVSVKHVLELMTRGVMETARWMNQEFLLDQMHEWRECSEVMIPSSDTVQRDEDYPSFSPGEFACPCVEVMQFPLHSRLRPQVAVASLAGKVMHMMRVHNRHNMFVWREKNGGRVFYLRLFNRDDVRQSTAATRAAVGPSLAAMPDESEDDASGAAQRGESDDGDARAETLDMGAGLPEHVSRSVYSGTSGPAVVLEVYGTCVPGSEISVDLNEMLASKIHMMTLSVISTFLSRNPLTRITQDDMSFLQPPGQPATQVRLVRVPRRVTDMVRFLAFVRSCGQLFLYPLHVATPSEDVAHGAAAGGGDEGTAHGSGGGEPEGRGDGGEDDGLHMEGVDDEPEQEQRGDGEGGDDHGGDASPAAAAEMENGTATAPLPRVIPFANDKASVQLMYNFVPSGTAVSAQYTSVGRGLGLVFWTLVTGGGDVEHIEVCKDAYAPPTDASDQKEDVHHQQQPHKGAVAVPHANRATAAERRRSASEAGEDDERGGEDASASGSETGSDTDDDTSDASSSSEESSDADGDDAAEEDEHMVPWPLPLPDSVDVVVPKWNDASHVLFDELALNGADEEGAEEARYLMLHVWCHGNMNVSNFVDVLEETVLHATYEYALETHFLRAPVHLPVLNEERVARLAGVLRFMEDKGVASSSTMEMAHALQSWLREPVMEFLRRTLSAVNQRFLTYLFAAFFNQAEHTRLFEATSKRYHHVSAHHRPLHSYVVIGGNVPAVQTQQVHVSPLPADLSPVPLVSPTRPRAGSLSSSLTLSSAFHTKSLKQHAIETPNEVLLRKHIDDVHSDKRLFSRKCVVLAHMDNGVLRVQFYNWSAPKIDQVRMRMQLALQWSMMRQALLSSILHQKMGLFFHAPSTVHTVDPAAVSLSFGAARSTSDHFAFSLDNMDRLLESAAPPSSGSAADKQPKRDRKRKHKARIDQQLHTPQRFPTLLHGIHPLLPLQSSKRVAAYKDPLRRHGTHLRTTTAQHSITTMHEKNVQTLRALWKDDAIVVGDQSDRFDQRRGDLLARLVEHARLVDYNRAVMHLSQYTLLGALVHDDIDWSLAELCAQLDELNHVYEALVDAYIHYLEYLGIRRVYETDPPAHVATPDTLAGPDDEEKRAGLVDVIRGGNLMALLPVVAQKRVYLQKVFTGGLFIIEVSFHQSGIMSSNMYFYEVHTLDLDTLFTTPISSPADIRDGHIRTIGSHGFRQFQNVVHVNSFMFDFHVRQLHEWFTSPDKTMPTLFARKVLHKLSTHYDQRPAHARCQTLHSSLSHVLQTVVTPIKFVQYIARNHVHFQLLDVDHCALRDAFVIGSSSRMVQQALIDEDVDLGSMDFCVYATVRPMHADDRTDEPHLHEEDCVVTVHYSVLCVDLECRFPHTSASRRSHVAPVDDATLLGVCENVLVTLLNEAMVDHKRDVLWSKLSESLVLGSTEFEHLCALTMNSDVYALDPSLHALLHARIAWPRLFEFLTRHYERTGVANLLVREERHLIIFHPLSRDIMLHIHMLQSGDVMLEMMWRDAPVQAALRRDLEQKQRDHIEHFVNVVCAWMWNNAHT